MNRENTIGMFISSLLMGAIVGAVSGVIWAVALSNELKSGLYYGFLIGLIIGFVFFLFQRGVTSSGRVKDKESSYVSGSIMGGLLLISTLAAIIVGIVRWLFF